MCFRSETVQAFFKKAGPWAKVVKIQISEERILALDAPAKSHLRWAFQSLDLGRKNVVHIPNIYFSPLTLYSFLSIIKTLDFPVNSILSYNYMLIN